MTQAPIDLAAENRRLRDRVEELEDILGQCPAQIDRLTVLGLTPAQQRVFAMILRRGLVSRDAAHIVLHGARPDRDQPDPHIMDVHVVRVRAKLKKIGAPADIRNRWGEGWYMTPGDKAKFNAWIDQQWSGK